jgi:hypothetical protein
MLRPLLPLVCLLAMCFTAYGEDFRVITDKPLTRDIREIFVEIQNPVPEAEVRRIASAIKTKAKKQYPKTSIWFLLPGMEPGSGAWARALYKPDLEITILGPKAEEQVRAGDKKQPEGQVVGSWSSNASPLQHKILILKRDQKCFLVRVGSDGSTSEEEITEEVPRKKFARRKSRHGEYMLIGQGGHLEFWDKDGKFDTAQKTP